MPEIGEIQLAEEIGKDYGKYYGAKYIWQSCPKCNIPRWVLIKYSLQNSFCMKCHIERTKSKIHKAYKGRYELLARKLKIEAEWTCSKCGWKAENKLECRSIHVHHKDGNPVDNSDYNLEVLCSPCHHKTYRYSHKKRGRRKIYRIS